jgi:hypothetical protein
MLIFPESLPYPSNVNIKIPNRSAQSGDGGATITRARSREYLRVYTLQYELSSAEYAVFSAFMKLNDGARISINLPGHGGYQNRYVRSIKPIEKSANDYGGFDVSITVAEGA